MRVACLTLLRHANVTLQHIPPLLNSAQFRSAMTVGLDDPAGLSGSGSGTTNSTRPCARRSSAPSWPGCARSCCATSSNAPCATRSPASTWARSSTAGSCWSASRKAPWARTPASCSARWSWRRCGRPPPPARNSPPDQRRDASLIIDEAQNFLTLASSLDTMLAEARKYRLSMIAGPPGPGPVPPRAARRRVGERPQQDLLLRRAGGRPRPGPAHPARARRARPDPPGRLHRRRPAGRRRPADCRVHHEDPPAETGRRRGDRDPAGRRSRRFRRRTPRAMDDLVEQYLPPQRPPGRR